MWKNKFKSICQDFRDIITPGPGKYNGFYACIDNSINFSSTPHPPKQPCALNHMLPTIRFHNHYQSTLPILPIFLSVACARARSQSSSKSSRGHGHVFHARPRRPPRQSQLMVEEGAIKDVKVQVFGRRGTRRSRDAEYRRMRLRETLLSEIQPA